MAPKQSQMGSIQVVRTGEDKLPRRLSLFELEPVIEPDKIQSVSIWASGSQSADC